MTFAEEHLDSLAALRILSAPLFVQLLQRTHPDRASYDEALALVRDRCSELDDDETGTADLAALDLTQLLATPSYRAFVQFLTDQTPDLGPQAQHLLETKEYELRLNRLKATSLPAYLGELRVISADEVAAALSDGTVLNALDADGQPAPIRSDEEVSAAFTDTPTATAYLDADTLTTVLGWFADPKNDLHPNPQGLRIRQVVIGGQLNLNWLDLPFPLGFEGCDFHYWVSADHLRVPWLSFDSCDFTPHGQPMSRSGALNAAGAFVSTSLRFWGCRGLGQLFIPDARIGEFSPANPSAPAGESPASFRTVIDGAVFGRVLFPTTDDDALPFEVTRSVSIGRIEFAEVDDGADTDRAVANRLYRWLTAQPDVPAEVWDELEAALQRSGYAGAATEFGVLGARHRTFGRRFGWVIRWTLGPTVRYFYDNLNALRWLLGLFAATLVLSFCTAGNFVQSPLANDSSLPDGWLGPIIDRLLWSLLYSFDTVVSPVSLGQAETVWPSWPLLALVFAVIKGLSLLMFGLLLTGVTGLAERRGQR